MATCHNLQLLLSFVFGVVFVHFFRSSNELATVSEGTQELDRELLSIVDNVLHPSYRELDRPDEPAEPEVEYQSRLNRVKSVCQKWAENGWYRANILPQEYESLEEWMRAEPVSSQKVKTESRMSKSGMAPNEMKMMVATKHNFMYCDLPKAASSTWLRIMFSLAEVKLDHGVNVHKMALDQEGTFLYHYPIEEQLERLATDYKALFVRHPFERLLSGFGNKVSHAKERSFEENVMSEVIQGNEYEASFGSEAAASVNLTRYDALNQAFDIESFHVFVDYLIKRGPGGGHDGVVWDTRQKHWRRAVDVCKVCSIEWSFIGKVESFDTDYNYMFDKLGLLDLVGRREENRDTKSSQKFYQYYRGLGRERIQALYELYQADFELFGYEVPSYLSD